ncbi:MAG: hypothetical protein QM564_13650 [Bergeyella sp.]
MKKIIFALFVLSCTTLTNSCNESDARDANDTVTANLNKISKNSAMNSKFVSLIQNQVKSSISKTTEPAYDLENVYYLPENDSYFVLQKEYLYDINSEKELLLSIPNENENFNNYLRVGVRKVDDNNYVVNYYNDVDDLLYSVNYVLEDDRINFTPLNTQNSTFSKSCGSAVAHCIQDAYSNHGWASVTIFIETAFIPETAVAIAGACALKNC